jgi:hypothetical protein
MNINGNRRTRDAFEQPHIIKQLVVKKTKSEDGSIGKISSKTHSINGDDNLNKRKSFLRNCDDDDI